MKILVTGATGYIGGYFIRMMQHNAEITALLRSDSNQNSLNNFLCSVLYFKSYDEILHIMKEKKFDGVVHFAAHISNSNIQENINASIDSNILYGTYLLEGASKSGVTWFINTGTFWQNFNSSNYCPVNLYAATKESFESISKYYIDISSMLYATIKINDTFGPFDTRNTVFSYIMNSSRRSKSVIKLTAGEQIIDVSFIEDIVNAYWQLIIELNKDHSLSGKTFVVTNLERYSLKKTVDVFQSALGRKFNIGWGLKPYRKREVMIPYNDGKTVPNWSQKYSLTEAFRKTYL
jgi:CDP-paratose synthetase